MLQNSVVIVNCKDQDVEIGQKIYDFIVGFFKSPTERQKEILTLAESFLKGSKSKSSCKGIEFIEMLYNTAQLDSVRVEFILEDRCRGASWIISFGE
ncbi:hypothetical protein Psch_03212 [Pelotomaculum schinkii]|uniref:Uncharacterized protein n=1 Tax=Pelotomaculum schinkii TaxID=78350 RepID=A0A4Y7RAZ6_9FIRM|nr:hypothetical protein [Pelotomaculum schinkii]TEB06168.1 hypothetical protein Psch_03212 [Pelotomaculum schinkii]